MLADALARSRAALRRATAKRSRALLARTRNDMREWVMKRRERTRHLIELGGLVKKSGLVELVDDDRAVIYGALLDMTAKLRGPDGETVLALWRRRGKRAFAQDLPDDDA